MSHYPDASVRPIDVVTRFYRNRLYPPPRPDGGKHDPLATTDGGAGITVVPRLQKLGVQTRVVGRYTDDDVPARDFLLSTGARSLLTKVDGPGGLNAVVMSDEPTIYRVVPVPGPWQLTSEEAAELVRCSSRATVLAGSLDADYVEDIIALLTARDGSPIFWNAGGKAPLELAGMGNVLLQVSYAEFGDGVERPANLAHRLLLSSGASTVVVTDAARGSVALTRATGVLLETPALPLPGHVVRRKVGCGDAFLAGFVAGWLNAAGEDRLPIALRLATVCGAHHATGLPAADWHELTLFERQYRPVARQEAA
jgi:sugar/nucleoside kinase (ribokinase family)